MLIYEIVVWNCVGIFVIISAVTLLQVTGVINVMKPEHERILFRVIIVEIAAVAVGAFALQLGEPDRTMTAESDGDTTTVSTNMASDIYLVQHYTTEGDGRQTKSLSCPEGREIIPGSAKCLSTAAPNSILVSEKQVGSRTWVCLWKPQPIGVGLWIEMGCA